MNLIGKIKVSNKIKVLPFRERNPPNLKLGGTYYVCFGNNNVYPCKLGEIINDFSIPEINIEIPSKPLSQNGFIDINGNISHHWVSTNLLYTTEIGLTPEHSVQNTVG